MRIVKISAILSNYIDELKRIETGSRLLINFGEKNFSGSASIPFKNGQRLTIEGEFLVDFLFIETSELQDHLKIGSCFRILDPINEIALGEIIKITSL